MPTYPRSVTPSPELQQSLNALASEVFSNITATAEPSSGLHVHPLHHMTKVDTKFKDYYHGLSPAYQRAMRSVVAGAPLRHPYDRPFLHWFYDRTAKKAMQKLESSVTQPFQKYKQWTIGYYISPDEAVLPEHRVGEPTSLRISREYVEGALEVGGEAFVFDETLSTVYAIARTTSGEHILNLTYHPALSVVRGSQRQNSHEYRGAPEDIDTIGTYFLDEVTPRFLGGGALRIDTAFESALTYACQQEREYRLALAQCG